MIFENAFEVFFFFHLNGASKALAEDFDADGDLDIAAIAMFADYRANPEQSFVYLENKGDLHFEASLIPEAVSGRWLTMDAGDLDGDGDKDIVLGSFINGSQHLVPAELKQRWENLERPLLYLENQLQ